MDTKLESLQVRIRMMEDTIAKKNNQLFNAFSIANPELLAKNPPYDFEYMRSIADAFHRYMNDLDAMGKHKLYAG